MPHHLYIVISDEKGNTLLGLKEAVNASESLQSVLNEPYLISRLLKDAQLGTEIMREMAVYKHPRYMWNGI